VLGGVCSSTSPYRNGSSVHRQTVRLDVMPDATTDVVVRDNPRELRYEALVDGRLVGLIRYRQEPGLVVLAHSEIDLDLEHTGVGSELVRGALADIRARNLRVVPHCPFVLDYIRRHPEEEELVGVDPALPE
jgi:predicted GNAT family acetyltransferase